MINIQLGTIVTHVSLPGNFKVDRIVFDKDAGELFCEVVGIGNGIRYTFPKTEIKEVINKVKDELPKSLVADMILFVTTKHHDQYDKGGSPYILHVLKVAHMLRTDDPELFCIALGHDVIEDTNATYQELRDIGCTERITEGIRCLTKMKGETYEEYKEKVKSNKDAMRVKMSDLRHNSDIRRLKGVTEKDILRIEKYHKFYLELKDLMS